MKLHQLTAVAWMLSWAVVPAAATAAAAEAVRMESLLQEMVQRDHLARFPLPAYTCRQFSSYDRDTQSPERPGWFANWDRSQFVRVEQRDGRREYVLMDADGPGAVVRFWATWAGPRGKFRNGPLRIYLDGRATPAIEGPIAELISGGALAPAPLSESVAPTSEPQRRGHNLYLPVPYARHCKITYESDEIVGFGARRGEALYYQINYRTYAPGTEVATLSRARLEELRPQIDQVAQRLRRSGIDEPAARSAGALSGALVPGQARSITLKGPAAIRQLAVRLQAGDLDQALRSTVLEMAFDGEQTVWCPLGDFFGTGHHIAPYRSWCTQVTADGLMKAWWVMPFEQSCQLTVRNVGQQEVRIAEAAVQTGDWSWDERSLHFHATWRQWTKIDTGPTKDQTGQGAFDVNYVEVAGKGQYVGDTLTLFNGTCAWWGEGDEKIYLDGEKSPSHIGTGTEDYYGYAWCRPEFFESAFHAQPNGSGNFTVGQTVNSRYRSLDALPFARSIKFDMELWHWKNTKMNYAPATFWYARPGATCNVRPDAAAAALPVARKRGDVVEALCVPGAVEGESLKTLETTGGTVAVQESDRFGWSGDRQLCWRDGKPGDRLVLELPCPKAGDYLVTANLTKAADYAVVSIKLNGQPAARPLDRIGNRLGHDAIELGRFTLQKGPNRLEVEIVGTNLNRTMFGLDYLLLQEAK